MNKRWVVILAFCGVFVAGAVVGGLVVRRGSPPPAEQYRGPPPPPNLDRFTTAIMRRYTTRLELDETQCDQVKKIVLEAEDALRELRGNTFQESIVISDRMNAQVALLLRTDQYERFEKLKEAVQNYWERERERRKGEHPRSPADRGSEKPDKQEKTEKSKKTDKREVPRKPEKEKR